MGAGGAPVDRPDLGFRCSGASVVLREPGSTSVFRYRCKCWGCRYCGVRRCRHAAQRIEALARENHLQRLATLTLPARPLTERETPEDHQRESVREIRSVWARFRSRLFRSTFQGLRFVGCVELTQAGTAHLHVLISAYIPQRWLQKTWKESGGGSIVHIVFCDLGRVARYVSKYISKAADTALPKGIRRFTLSRPLRLWPPPKGACAQIVDADVACLRKRLCADGVACGGEKVAPAEGGGEELVSFAFADAPPPWFCKLPLAFRGRA
ncbi:MAG: rolling circle replication-associated protein [Terriglobales bacterium]